MRSSEKYSTIILFIIIFLYSASTISKGDVQKSNIIINVLHSKGEVNKLIFGENILGFKSKWKPNDQFSNFGSGIWNGKWNKSKKEVINLAKAIHVSSLRFPGGCGVNDYDWKKTIEKNRSDFYFGINEFLKVVKELDAEPIFTLSYFTGSSNDAADLAEYLNCLPDSKHIWALKRVQNGVIQPFRIKYFEVGNEIYQGDGHNITSIAPIQYAQTYLKYYEKLKKVDPHIQVGAVLYTDFWNRTICKIIKNRIDFGIIHVYPTPIWGEKLGDISAHEIFDVSLALPEAQYQLLFDQTKELFKKYIGKEVPLAITEFNGGFAQDKPVPYRHTLGNALVNAELLKLFMKPENNILMANYWNFVNEYWGMIANGFQGDPKDFNNPYYKRPNYYTFEMYAKHFGDLMLKADVQSEGYRIDKYDELKTFLKQIKPGTLFGPNLLNGDWQVIDVPGVSVAQNDGILQINFENPTEFNYYHVSKGTPVEPGGYYRLSGYIKTDHLVDDKGVCLEIQDARGWDLTHSAESTDKVTGTTDWQYVEAVYQTLPDAKAVNVIARRIGDAGPLKGQAFFKDVKLEKFVPSLNTKIPYLSVNASKSADGNKVYLMVVNKNMDAPMTSSIELKDFMPASKGEAWVLNGPSIDATNEQNHDNVKVIKHEFTIKSNLFEYTFEPHSLTAIEIERKK